MKILFFVLLAIGTIFYSSCNEEDSSILWKKNIGNGVFIDGMGLGYPIYKNTVVFHSTTSTSGGYIHNVIHGLDTKTGKEKWKLTNEDFSPKKDLEFFNCNYYYQQENILVVGDYVLYDIGKESYIYAIDIDAGSVLWVKPFPRHNQQGRMIRGRGNYCYRKA